VNYKKISTNRKLKFERAAKKMAKEEERQKLCKLSVLYLYLARPAFMACVLAS
jgi:hypothetical protein